MNDYPHVCVVGSINMDLVTRTTNMPAQGETILAGEFQSYPGGKGANQAVAAARLGANVSMIGAVGEDSFGEILLKNLKNEGINQENVHVIPGVSTGIATIIVSENDNRIIVSSGANAMVTPELVANAKDLILACDIILLQFEVPMETVQYTVDLAAKHNIKVIVNPAPFQDIPEEILNKVSYLTPNEIEYASLSSLSLVDSIKNKMIVTKGADGVEYCEGNSKLRLIPAFKVTVKDTTGAGDTFNGALATELARTNKMDKAIAFANATAALSVQKHGAQEGMPTRAEVIKFMEEIQ